MDEIFVVVGKLPLKGYSKTRLANGLGADKAQDIYKAMIFDFFSNFKKHQINKKFFFYGTPIEEITRTFFVDIFRALNIKYEFEYQSLGPLFERLQKIFEMNIDSFIHVTGTDIPDFPFHFLNKVLIDENVVNLGPDEDGGYYYISSSSKNKELFSIPKDLEGKPNVLEATISKANELGLRVNLLPSWSDIDTLDDLEICLKRSPKELISHTHAAFFAY